MQLIKSEIDSISEVIAQNSATAEESAASCAELNSQATTLREKLLFSRFSPNDSTGYSAGNAHKDRTQRIAYGNRHHRVTERNDLSLCKQFLNNMKFEFLRPQKSMGLLRTFALRRYTL